MWVVIEFMEWLLGVGGNGGLGVGVRWLVMEILMFSYCVLHK